MADAVVSEPAERGLDAREDAVLDVEVLALVQDVLGSGREVFVDILLEVVEEVAVVRYVSGI